jgi:CRP/FNR family transcriptional regulator, cyclic AMP receptor protein
MEKRTSRSLLIPEIVFADPALTPLPPAERAAILSAARTRTVRAGEILYRRGEQPDGIYVVVNGMIRITGISRAGDEFILDLSGRGMWIGELAVLEGSERTHDAIAEVRSSVLFLSCADIERLLSTWSAFARSLLRLEARRFRRAAAWAEQSATAPLDARLATRLMLLTHRDPLFAISGKTQEVKITQMTLSRLVGTTRQRINQVLQEWEGQKLIKTSRGGLRILNFKAIESKFGSTEYQR